MVGYDDFWRFVVFCSSVYCSISLVMKKMIQMSAEDWLLVAVDANHCSYGLSVQLRMPDTKTQSVRLNAKDPERRICTSSGVLTPISDSLKLL